MAIKGWIPVLMVVSVSGCAFIPVQETTLKNDQGSTITCKQTGRGVVSYWIGKSVYQDCVAKANANGFH